LLDRGSYSIERDLLYLLPVINQSEYLFDSRPEVRVGSQHMPHQILHLLRVLIFLILDVGVDDAEFSFFLEGVIPIVEDEQHATKHPNVDPVVDGVLQIQVDHFWGSVHERSVLLEPLLVVIQLSFANLLKINQLLAAAPQIAQLKHSLFCKQDVLDLHVLVENT
jgi:hypothetical protein